MDTEILGSRESFISQAMARLDGAVSVATDKVGNLEAVMDRVLTHTPVLEKAPTKDAGKTTVPIADQLNEITNRVDCIIERLEALTLRCEI